MRLGLPLPAAWGSADEPARRCTGRRDGGKAGICKGRRWVHACVMCLHPERNMLVASSRQNTRTSAAARASGAAAGLCD